MVLSRFWALRCRGHLEQAKQICSYLYWMRHATIRFCTHEPDYSDLPNVEHKWDASVYGNVEEELQYKALPPPEKQVILTNYVDANLYHNVLTGRSVMGVLYFINGTPIDVLPMGLSLLLPGHALSISSITPSYTKGTLAMENTKYELQDFHGGGKTTTLICYRNKIEVPNKLQKAVISWYHTTLHSVILELREQKKQLDNIYGGQT
jgi:hypothetical protein